MSTFISLLRGINVGGQKPLRMESLRAIYAELDFINIRTYVQSGNVIFESQEQDQLRLHQRIEARIEQTCGYPIKVFILQPAELDRILKGNPFINDRNEDLSKLHVTFLYQTPADVAWNKLTPPGNMSDEFAPGEMAVYLFCPNGYGKTRLSNNFFKRKLGVPVTTRNWNTVGALYNMAINNPSKVG